MGIRVKLLEPAETGWTLKEEFGMTGDEAPSFLDVPNVLLDADSPLRRYRFRLKTDEAYYYTPVEEKE